MAAGVDNGDTVGGEGMGISVSISSKACPGSIWSERCTVEGCRSATSVSCGVVGGGLVVDGASEIGFDSALGASDASRAAPEASRTVVGRGLGGVVAAGGELMALAAAAARPSSVGAALDEVIASR